MAGTQKNTDIDLGRRSAVSDQGYGVPVYPSGPSTGCEPTPPLTGGRKPSACPPMPLALPSSQSKTGRECEGRALISAAGAVPPALPPPKTIGGTPLQSIRISARNSGPGRPRPAELERYRILDQDDTGRLAEFFLLLDRLERRLSASPREADARTAEGRSR
jgi:hypothetical protein